MQVPKLMHCSTLIVQPARNDKMVMLCRLHMDPWNDNPNMADLIAYRIKSVDHPRTKAEWRIYPSYDCAHSLVDASENITHSLCTLEFEARRASYYWLLHVSPLCFYPECDLLNQKHSAHSLACELRLRATACD